MIGQVAWVRKLRSTGCGNASIWTDGMSECPRDLVASVIAGLFALSGECTRCGMRIGLNQENRHVWNCLVRDCVELWRRERVSDDVVVELTYTVCSLGKGIAIN